MWKEWIQKINKTWKRGMEEKDISWEELKQKEKEGAMVVDTRSSQEYQEGHIEGAISLPEYEIKQKAEKQIPNKQETIIVYCSTGHRSKKAQKELEKMGYEKIYNLEGGIENIK